MINITDTNGAKMGETISREEFDRLEAKVDQILATMQTIGTIAQEVQKKGIMGMMGSLGGNPFSPKK